MEKLLGRVKFSFLRILHRGTILHHRKLTHCMPQSKNYFNFMPKQGFAGNASVLYNSVNRPLVSCHQTILLFKWACQVCQPKLPMYFTDFKVLPGEADLNHPKGGGVAGYNSLSWKNTPNDFLKEEEKKGWYMMFLNKVKLLPKIKIFQTGSCFV